MVGLDYRAGLQICRRIRDRLIDEWLGNALARMHPGIDKRFLLVKLAPDGAMHAQMQ
jgi:hypothetical protein